MPSRAPPKAYHLLLKTHKLTIFLTVHQSVTVAKLKEDALSALMSGVLTSPSEPLIPTAPAEDVDMVDDEQGNSVLHRIQSMDDFELCRAVKDKGKSSAASSSSAPTSYEILQPSSPIKGLLSNWETLYVQFRDEDGNLLPIEVSQPPLLDEEDEDPRRAPPVQESSVAVGKGKRKAPPE